MPIGRRLPYGMAASVINVDAANETRKATFIPGHARTSMAMTFVVATSTARASMAIMATLPLAAPVVFRSGGRVGCSVVPVQIGVPEGTDSWGTLAENPSRRAFRRDHSRTAERSGPGLDQAPVGYAPKLRPWVIHFESNLSVASKSDRWVRLCISASDRSSGYCHTHRPPPRADSQWGRPDVYRGCTS